MEITALHAEHIPAAAALFRQNWQGLHQAFPILPELMNEPATIAKKLPALLAAGPGVAALDDNGQLCGYLGGYLIKQFRGADHKGVYCPEWGHSTTTENRPAIYRALYRAAAEQWAAAGCRIHALSLLAHDQTARETWFWQGFGLAVVDAIRPLDPLPGTATPGFVIRPAAPADASILATLEAEHCLHYERSPLFMAPRTAHTDFAELLANPKNRVWLALHGDQPVGYMQFEGGQGNSDLVSAATTVATTGAYVRPAHRGQHIASALLAAALREFPAMGFERCSVDFESFNPEAAVFWPRYFTPVCLSLFRMPETVSAAQENVNKA